jgi:hypothetical protein
MRVPLIISLALSIGLTIAPVSAAPHHAQHAPGSLARFTHLPL